jgi:hypothetical protein
MLRLSIEKSAFAQRSDARDENSNTPELIIQVCAEAGVAADFDELAPSTLPARAVSPQMKLRRTERR